MLRRFVLRVTNHDYEWHPKYFAVVVGIFCALYMINNAIVSKITVIAGIPFTVALIIFPLCAIITDLLTEVYGFNRTRQAIWTVLAATVLFALFTQAAILLPPADFWPYQAAFEAVFASSWRIAMAGIAAWVVGEFVNSYILSKLKIFQQARHMAARFIGSTVIGQFFDSAIFFTIAFAGTVPWDQLLIMTATAWAVKIAYEIAALPLSIPVANWLKRLEGVEHFDRQKISVV